MAKIHDLFIVELAEVIKGYGNAPDVKDPFRLSEFYRFYELPNIAVSRENFEKMRPIEPERWIPCSERLPFAEYGESDKVLATCGYLNVEDTSVRWIRELYFNGGNWCYPTGETYEQKVYAWMPLPEPYKEGES